MMEKDYDKDASDFEHDQTQVGSSKISGGRLGHFVRYTEHTTEVTLVIEKIGECTLKLIINLRAADPVRI